LSTKDDAKPISTPKKDTSIICIDLCSDSESESNSSSNNSLDNSSSSSDEENSSNSDSSEEITQTPNPYQTGKKDRVGDDVEHDLSKSFASSLHVSKISAPSTIKKIVSTPSISKTSESIKDISSSFYPGGIPKGLGGEEFVQKRENLLFRVYKYVNERGLDSILPPATYEILRWNDRLRSAAGHCRQRNVGGVHSFVIEISKKVVDNSDKLMRTLSHEMAHAVVREKKIDFCLFWR
jgi:hypothetical protein